MRFETFGVGGHDLLTKQALDPRYENKFQSPTFGIHAILALAKTHPECLLEAYPTREVNSIYLDTPSLNTFRDGEEGIPDRYKVRIRWYGERNGWIPAPMLEFKIKKGGVGLKVAFPLTGFHFDGTFSPSQLLQVVTKSQVEPQISVLLRGFVPILSVSYRRHYFKFAASPCRITMDSDITFRSLRWSGYEPLAVKLSENPILELKYPASARGKVGAWMQHFPVLLTKSSKYISGVQGLGLSG